MWTMLKQTNVSIFFSYKSISLLIIDNTTQHDQHMIIGISMRQRDRSGGRGRGDEKRMKNTKGEVNDGNARQIVK